MRRVLSLDWDYFTGDCSDKGACCGWSCSHSDDRGRGDKNVLYGFEYRVRNPHARAHNLLEHPFTIRTLVVAECHASILAHLKPGDIITHLDWHLDESPYDYSLDCGNWVNYAKKRLPGIQFRYHQNHPPVQYQEHYDLEFVCKSSPWTPPEYDKLLHQFVDKLALRCPTGIRWYGHRGRELRREHARFRVEAQEREASKCLRQSSRGLSTPQLSPTWT